MGWWHADRNKMLEMFSKYYEVERNNIIFRIYINEKNSRRTMMISYAGNCHAVYRNLQRTFENNPTFEKPDKENGIIKQFVINISESESELEIERKRTSKLTSEIEKRTKRSKTVKSPSPKRRDKRLIEFRHRRRMIARVN